MQLPDLEVWFQRATDVVRKLLYGDVDIGIVGYDMFAEIADADPELIVVHDALGFGGCHLGLGIPTTGKFAGIDTLEQLKKCVSPSCIDSYVAFQNCTRPPQIMQCSY